MKKTKIKTIVKEEEKEKSVIVTVKRFSLSLAQAENLQAGNIVQHNRVCKVLSIKHLEDRSAEVELEIIKRSWEHKHI
jgi:hypothetical protein